MGHNVFDPVGVAEPNVEFKHIKNIKNMSKTRNFTKAALFELLITRICAKPGPQLTNLESCSFSISSKVVLFAPQELVSIEGVVFKCVSANVDYGYTVVHNFELHLPDIQDFVIGLEKAHKDGVYKYIKTKTA